MCALHVYRASAGSGKTYVLTLHYLKLLLLDPDSYRNILAVTFTNKAAGEMKEKILERLHELSEEKPGGEYGSAEGLNELSEDKGEGPEGDNEFMTRLVKETSLSRTEISKKAGSLLNRILNDYSLFSVGTIDKFFQSVIRAFTREMGIQPSYNLEMDQERVLDMAVNQLFQKITGNSELRQWLYSFAEERMKEDRSWDFSADIRELGKQLFSEGFQRMFEGEGMERLGKGQLGLYLEELGGEEVRASEKIREMAGNMVERFDSLGFERAHFSGKQNSYISQVEKAAAEGKLSLTITKAETRSDPDKWLNKTASDQERRITEGEFIPALETMWQEQVILNTIAAIRRRFHTLGILGDLREELQDYLRSRNLFLISDSSRFLKGIIGGNQVPFIYEKTGIRYRNIMLDEFQDTSMFQYENFKPLLDNSLAEGEESLVVGDVKQSIYRWRNSDWEVLASELLEDFKRYRPVETPLMENHRSREEIIAFNNSLFEKIPGMLAELVRGEHSEEARRMFEDSYSNVSQKFPSNKKEGKGGLVRMDFLAEAEEIKFPEQVLEKLPGLVEELLDRGYRMKDIAILVRRSKEGAWVAGRLLEYARERGKPGLFNLVSNESLLLSENNAVALLIAAMHFLLSPEDKVNNALVKHLYRLCSAGQAPGGNDLYRNENGPLEVLPAAFANELDQLRRLSLFETVDRLISIFDLGRERADLPYLQAFQDLVIDLQRREAMDMTVFLYLWEQKKKKASVQVSNRSDAIQILTIHKAKGLQFKAVLIPFCNWDLKPRSSSVLWCRNRKDTLDRIPSVPVSYTKDLLSTLFAADYHLETMKSYMDNLNLLYVAFTRSIDFLYAAIPYKEEPGTISHVGQLVQVACNAGEGRMERGEMQLSARGKVKEEDWRIPANLERTARFTGRLRTGMSDLYADEEGRFNSSRVYGNMMHRVFAGIRYPDDLEEVAGNLRAEGLLPADEVDGMTERIRELITGSEAGKWFEKREGRKVFNERNVLPGGGRLSRPDRVIVDGEEAIVVDFKFGEQRRESHRKQVSTYMEHMDQMGYKTVLGYLWYVEQGHIEKILMQ